MLHTMIVAFAHFGFSFIQLIFYSTILAIFLWMLWNLLPRGKINLHGNKYVLITGCDSGFGKETAIRLDQMGFNVIATCLTEKGENSLRFVCSKRLKIVQLDVTKPEMIREVYAQVMETIPQGTGLWGLVNNAGIMQLAPIEWQSIKHFKWVAEVNLWGLIDVTKVFLPLVKQAKGRIVNVSSMAGQVSAPLYASYSITKYGIEAFSDALRREMKPWNVKVAIIEPGGFKTPLVDPMANVPHLQEMWNNLSEELKKAYGDDYVERQTKLATEATEYASSHTYLVCDAIVDAITSLSPRSRYRVFNNFLTYIFFIIGWLPATVGDTFFCFTFRDIFAKVNHNK